MKIAEGCDYKCSFCIIPTLRGHYRSRPEDSIVREAERLAARGVKELLLISQDTTFYGVDRQERGALARLLRRLNGVAGLGMDSAALPLSDDDRRRHAGGDGRVRQGLQVHRPAAAARVEPGAEAHEAPGDAPDLRQAPDRIRTRVPGVALRTTFIVGFPGETEADVEELAGFVRQQAFDHVGVFTYSHEEGTSAHALDNDVPQREKTSRRRRVMSLQKRGVQQRQRRRVGERARVLVDGPSGEHELVVKARLATQAPDIDAAVYLTECDPSSYRPGDFAEVTIVGARDYDLIGRPVL